MLVPALRLAEEDRHTGQLDPDRLELMHAAVREIVDDLAEQSVDLPSPVSPKGAAPGASASARPLVFCTPAHDEADELVAQMLMQLLVRSGCDVAPIGHEAITSSQFEASHLRSAAMIWISALPPMGDSHARELCKRLRARASGSKILVGQWTGPTSAHSKEQLHRAGATEIVFSLKEAIDATAAVIAPPPAAEKSAEAPAPPSVQAGQPVSAGGSS
jgi:hypothetical protein